MNHILTINYDNKPAYDIRIETDFHQLKASLKELNMENRKFMIISDTNVSSFYLEDCVNIFRHVSGNVYSYVFPAGEGSKNLDTVNLCYEALIKASFDRNDVLVALGGGVVGDLTGFVAATYLRGVRFIQLPTTLLSMVDSSIGGKTGVDYKAYKNMVGAFHQPKLVYMNLSTLLSLEDKEFFSGMSEIIKHGLIMDQSYYKWIKDHTDKIKSKDYLTLSEMIIKSCRIKKEVVEEDPKEQGVRALLNFGHTIGHSVEKLKELTLLHGECVSIGAAAASYISLKQGYINKEEFEDILSVFRSFYQPISVIGLNAEDILAVTKHDKKMDSDKIKFILLKGIGKAFIDNTLTKDDLLEGIHSILISDRKQ